MSTLLFPVALCDRPVNGAAPYRSLQAAVQEPCINKDLLLGLNTSRKPRLAFKTLPTKP